MTGVVRRPILILLLVLLMTATLTAHAGAAAQTAETPAPDHLTGYAWSDDGQMLAIATESELRVYHVGQPDVTTLPVAGADRLTFGFNNNLLAFVDKQKTIQVWELSTHRQFGEWGVEYGLVSGMQFFPGSNLLAVNVFDFDAAFGSGISHTGIWFWKFRSGEISRTIQTYSNPGEFSLAFSRDRKLVYTVIFFTGNDGIPGTYYIYVRDVSTGEMRHMVGVASNYIRQMTFSPTDADKLLIVDGDGVVKLVNPIAEEAYFALALPFDLVRSAVFSPDGRLLATGGTDGKARVWDANTGALIALYLGQPADIDDLRFDLAGHLLALSVNTDTPQIWDVELLSVVARFDPVSH